MAGGRSSGSGSSRRGRSTNDTLHRLAQLGEGADASPGSASPANEDGLKTLGQRIDGRQTRGASTVPGRRSRPGHRRRPRWSRKSRVLTVLRVVIVLPIGVVGSGYAYLRYECGKVQKVYCSSFALVTSAVAPFNVLVVGSD